MKTNNNLHREPLHEQITRILRKEILSGYKPGQRLAPEKELAKRFSVSIVTVREAVLCLAREGLLERRQGSGTYVRDCHRRQYVGILTEADISSPQITYFCLRVMQQLRRYFRETGYRSRLYVGDYSPSNIGAKPSCMEFSEDIDDGQMSGVVVVQTPPQEPWFELLKRNRVPLVGGVFHYEYGVGFDYTDMIEKGIRLLAEHGRRKIALLGWGSPTPSETLMKPCRDVFKESMARHGLSLRENWIRFNPYRCSTGAGWEDFRNIWITEQDKPDGLLVLDDVLFRDVAVAIMEMGIKVPEQLMIATLFNKGDGIVFPFPIAKLEFDPDAYARTAGEMLVNLMTKKPIHKKHAYLSCRCVPEMPEDKSVHHAGRTGK